VPVFVLYCFILFSYTGLSPLFCFYSLYLVLASVVGNVTDFHAHSRYVKRRILCTVYVVFDCDYYLSQRCVRYLCFEFIVLLDSFRRRRPTTAAHTGYRVMERSSAIAARVSAVNNWCSVGLYTSLNCDTMLLDDAITFPHTRNGCCHAVP